MIEEPTLFILGAGASLPYAYPTGVQLRELIIKQFYKNYDSLLNSDKSSDHIPIVPELDKANKFVKVFNAAPLYSIDKFLSLSPSFKYIGKIAITQQIFKCEEKSERIEGEYRTLDWFEFLFNRMVSSLSKADDYTEFKKNKVSFITFNYDRSLEYLLYSGFLNSFHDNQQEILQNFGTSLKEFVPFPIIHVYGCIDKPSWFGGSYYGEKQTRYFGLKELSENIHVINEERTIDLKDEIADLISKSKRIFFLGFGFADENLDALGHHLNLGGLRIFCTAYNKTDKQMSDFRHAINRHFRVGTKPIKDVYIEKKTCLELLTEHL